MSNDGWISIAVIAACFVSGYAIINFIFNMLRPGSPTTSLFSNEV